MAEVQKIGFLGAGLMGFGMAKCLLESGVEVKVLQHRNPEPIIKLTKMGAGLVTRPKDVLLDTDGLVSCLPNAEIVDEVAEILAPEFKTGMFWIDTTTSKPETSKRIADCLRENGAIFADAPVTGGPVQAVEGQLASLVGCNQEDYHLVVSIIGVYSNVMRRFGGVGSGNIAKLLNNLVSQGMTILLADAFLCAERKGIDRQALYDVMSAGSVRSYTLEKIIKPYLSGDYDGSKFTIENSLKDLRYVNELMVENLPGHADLSEYLAHRLAKQVEQGRGNSFVSNLLMQDYILRS
ncbi:MAG: NAD(P)-dependent oxidoreductase [Rhodobacteraceae bacterium]|nr:NAD(P)-dependent oxidoreductase [Paracoccaceae bacterium]